VGDGFKRIQIQDAEHSQQRYRSRCYGCWYCGGVVFVMKKKRKTKRYARAGSKKAWAQIAAIQKKAIRDIRAVAADPFSPESIAKAAGKPNPGRGRPRINYTPGYD
jgi:hypothetical protein